jgi:nucleotide-binding universal stress UspA family protein
MVKSLLVAYDGSHGSRVALQLAVDLARQCEGRITLLTVSQNPQPEAAGLADSGDDVVGLASRELGTDDNAPPPDDGQLPSEAYDLCRDLPVRCRAQPASGDLAFAAVRASRLADLLLVGRDVAGGAGRLAASARTGRRVAGTASCPVAITPREYEPIRSALAVCPMSDVGARSLRTAAELAALLQVKLDVLVVAQNVDLAGRWTGEVRRYLVDHGRAHQVIVRRPPLGAHLDAALTDRQGPLVVLPRDSWLTTARGRDALTDALRALSATIVVQP